MTLLQHLIPPFDSWWPNIIGSAVWGVPGLVLGVWHIVRSRRSHRELHAKVDALHQHLGIDQRRETAG